MKPFDLSTVEISPIVVDEFIIKKLEIDLKHVNYGLDPKSKRFKKKARSKITVEEVIKIFLLLDGIIIKPTSILNGYAYYSSEVYPLWLKNWFRLVFCIELKSPKIAGVITIYQIKRK